MCDTIFVIGSNSRGQLGLRQAYIDKPTNFTEYYGEKHISNIYFASDHAIYTDNNHQNIWCAGSTSHHQPNKLNIIDHFNQQNINIKKVCTNCTSHRTFWITDKGSVYQNGIDGKAPHLISCLHDVIDIQSSDEYSVALCKTNTNIAVIILESWIRILVLHNIPTDIISLITFFYHINIVKATNGFGNGKVTKDNDKWEDIHTLKDTNIIKISSGRNHALFLDANGNVFGCGNNEDNQLGIENIASSNKPILNEWFMEKNIKIKDIVCGGHHCLAIDTNHKVYSWGYNDEGQCGNGTLHDVEIPHLIPGLEKYEVEYIECGFWHSYCSTFDGKHFIFGENDFMQCIVDDNDQDFVKKPECINDIIKEIVPNKVIKGLVLGNDMTAIMLGDS